MKKNHWLSRWMMIVILILATLPAYGASKPGAAEKKAPIMEAPSKELKKTPAQRQLKIPTAALPDLVVTDIALDNACRLAITIQNKGRGAVEPGDLQRAAMKITPSGAKATELRMALLMPGIAVLKPGAKATMNTTIIVERSGLVTVEADSGRVIAETNESNNQMRKTLSPHCTKATDSTTRKPAKDIVQTKASKIQLGRPAAQDPEGAEQPQYFSGEIHGIAVLEPVRRQVYAQGSLVVVSWSDANPGDGLDAESGAFVFLIRRQGGAGDEACATCGHEVGRATVAEPQFTIQVPTYMMTGADYYVRVYAGDNPEVYGDSDIFSIGPVDEEALIELHDPPPCPDWVHPMHCHARTQFRVDQPIVFTLRRSGDSAVIGEIFSAVLLSVYHSAPSVPMALTEFSNFTIAELSWTPPPDTAVPIEYRIEIGYRFAHDAPDVRRYVNSERFYLNPPWSEPDLSSHNQIAIRNPEAGDTVYTGSTNTLWAQWQCELCDDTSTLSYTRILLKGGEELQRIGPIAYSHLGMSPREWFSIFGYLSGSDYQVRIELNRHNDETDALEMIASDTTGYFAILNNRAEPPGALPLRLLEPGAYEDTSFAIGTPIHISWSHSPPASAEYRVRLSLTQDTTEGGGAWPIAADIPAAPNEMDWVIPGHIPPGSGYRVLIERIDGAGSSNSYIPFTITP
jgi:hypothetical protein